MFKKVSSYSCSFVPQGSVFLGECGVGEEKIQVVLYLKISGGEAGAYLMIKPSAKICKE